MGTIFQSRIFQKVTFIFKIAIQDEADKFDARGNRLANSNDHYCVTFKIRPNGGQIDRKEDKIIATEPYKAYLLQVNKKNTLSLPKCLKIGSVGFGCLNGRECECEITSIGQSGVSPITTRILGEKVNLLIRYRNIGSIGIGL